MMTFFLSSRQSRYRQRGNIIVKCTKKVKPMIKFDTVYCWWMIGDLTEPCPLLFSSHGLLSCFLSPFLLSLLRSLLLSFFHSFVPSLLPSFLPPFLFPFLSLPTSIVHSFTPSFFPWLLLSFLINGQWRSSLSPRTIVAPVIYSTSIHYCPPSPYGYYTPHSLTSSTPMHRHPWTFVRHQRSCLTPLAFNTLL